MSLFSSGLRKGNSRHRAKAGVNELIDHDVGNAMDDVALMEEKSHATEKALKKYAHACKEELIRAERLLQAVADEAATTGEGAESKAAALGDALLGYEKTYSEGLEHVALDPMKSFGKVFPEVMGVSNGFVRAAQDLKKAKERHKQAESKHKDTQRTKAQLLQAQQHFDRQATALPEALRALLRGRYDYFEASLNAVLRVQELKADGTLSKLQGDGSADAGAELNALIDQIHGISIVGHDK